MKNNLTSLLSLLAFLSFLIAAGSPDRLARYADNFEKIQIEVKSKRSEHEKLDALEMGFQFFMTISKDDGSDFLARSFAGALGSQRSLHMANLGDKAKNVKEAILLLDDAVRDARVSNNEQELLQTLRNRAETYSSLPAFFNKGEIAVQDSRATLDLGIKLKLAPEQMVSLNLLRVRALCRSSKPPKNGKSDKTDQTDRMARIKNAQALFNLTKTQAHDINFKSQDEILEAEKALDEAK